MEGQREKEDEKESACGIDGEGGESERQILGEGARGRERETAASWRP